MSVVLLNYNHGQFLAEAFTALASGLRRIDSELIVIDDASTDDSRLVLERLRASFPTFRLVARSKNQGVIAGMNEGLGLARGSYIYFAASDDRIQEDLFERSLHLLHDHPEAALCAARTRILDKDSRDLGLLRTTVVTPVPSYLSPEEVKATFRRDDNWLVGNTTIYRRDLLLSVGGFRPELGSFCDGFASRLLAFQHGACFIPDPLSGWRRMSEGYSQSETADMARVEQIAERALLLYRDTYCNVFPPDYAQRWRQRWLFGARAHALYKWRMHKLEPDSGSKKKGGLAVARRAAINLVWLARLAVMFVCARPFDIVPTLKRHLGYMRS